MSIIKEVLSPLMAVDEIEEEKEEEKEEEESSTIVINEGNERVGLTSEEAERVRHH
jgi:tRNA C32,U32 (ribose-2'-O)-methylase TrmJ